MGNCPPARRTARGAAQGSARRARCAGSPSTKDEKEIEVQFAHDGATPGLDKYTLHVRCFAAWEFERVKAASAPRLEK
jgi:hypothetical protein